MIKVWQPIAANYDENIENREIDRHEAELNVKIVSIDWTIGRLEDRK